MAIVKKKKISQEEIDTNKVMFVIILSFLGEAILFYMYRYFNTAKGFASYMKNGWITSVSIGAVLFVAGLIWFILWKLNKYECKTPSWTPFNWFCTSIFVFGALSYIKIRNLINPQLDPAGAVKYLFLVVLLFAILYIIFYFNRRSFFTFSVLSTIFGTMMYMFSKLPSKWYVSLYIVSAIVVVLTTLFVIICQKNNGNLVINNKSLKFFSSKSKYYFHFALIAIFIACILAFVFLGIDSLRYSLYTIIGVEIVMSIYSTYKII